MKDWYQKLKIEYQVVFWSLIVILGLFTLTIPFYFFHLMEIPQGIALGGMLAILIYLFLGLFNNEEKQKQSVVATVIILIVKFILISGLLVLVGWLYYGLGFKAFNIFAVAGGYFIPLVINLFLLRKEKADGCSK